MLGYLLSPVLQIEDTNGIPLVGGKIFVYKANTSNLATIYSNYEGTLSTNPVILDELGHATIIADDESLYDITVKDSGDNLIMSAEDVAVGGGLVKEASTAKGRGKEVEIDPEEAKNWYKQNYTRDWLLGFTPEYKEGDPKWEAFEEEFPERAAEVKRNKEK